MKNKKIADFVLDLRIRKKFQNLKDVSQYAKTKGFPVSSESIRLFEVGERIPNEGSREMLAKIYQMTPEQQKELERLCADALIRNSDFSSSLVVIDADRLSLIQDAVSECPPGVQVAISSAIKKILP